MSCQFFPPLWPFYLERAWSAPACGRLPALLAVQKLRPCAGPSAPESALWQDAPLWQDALLAVGVWCWGRGIRACAPL